MENNIESVYAKNGYTKKKIEDGSFFSLEKRDKVNFCVIVKTTPSNALNMQDELWNNCKEICNNPAFDKNCSLLILWEVDSLKTYNEIKDEVLNAEENPYMFRKYVLYYRSEERRELREKLNGKTLNDFIKENVIDTVTFNDYKGNPFSISWQSLLYRIVIKLPFIKIANTEGENLESLFVKNNNSLGGKNLKGDNDKILTAIQGLSIEDIKDRETEKLYDLLKPILGEE
jgi:hypothetical protein